MQCIAKAIVGHCSVEKSDLDWLVEMVFSCIVKPPLTVIFFFFLNVCKAL